MTLTLPCLMLVRAQSALDPAQRLSAVRTGLSGAQSAVWTVVIALVIGALASAACIALVRASHGARRRRLLEEFRVQAETVGLSAEEASVLLHVADLAGLSRPDSVFTSVDAFEKGVVALCASPRAAELDGPVRQQMDSVLTTLRQKLAIHHQSSDADEARVSTHQIPKGAVLTVVLGDDWQIDTPLETNSPQGLAVACTQPVRAGQIALVRHSNMGSVWEFDTPVVSYGQGQILLRHTERIRFVNRRRFARIPTDKKALLAVMPFRQPTQHLSSVEMAPAKVVEIAGPGLLLRSPASAEIGQRVLVAVELDSGLNVQAFGKVRRVDERDEEGNVGLAVELIDLNENEMGDLSRATAKAARPGAKWRAMIAHASATPGRQ